MRRWPGLQIGTWVELCVAAAALLALALLGLAVYILVPEGRDRLLECLGVALLGAVPLAALLAWLLRSRIVHPLAALTRATASLAEGNLEAALPAAAADEIGKLAGSLEGLRRSVRRQAEELALLDRVGRDLEAASDTQSLLAETARHLADALQATGCVVSLWDRGMARPALVSTYGRSRLSPEARVVGDLSISQMVIGSGEPVVVRDVQTSTLLDQAAAWPAKSLLAIPLLAQGSATGAAIGAALIDDDRQERGFADEEVALALAIGRRAASAIDNMRLYESTQRRLHDLSLLYQTSATISSTLDEGALLDLAVQACARVFAVDQVQLLTLDGPWARLAAGHQSPLPEAVRDGRFSVQGNALVDWMVANKRPVVIREARTDPLLEQTRAVLAWPDAVSSVLAVPLVAKGEVLGIILLRVLGERDFAAEEVGLALTVGNQVASVVQNARLYRQMGEEKRKFELAALNMGEGLIIIDSEDRVLFANPQAHRLLAWEIDEGLDTPPPSYLPASLRPLLARREEAGEGILAGEVQIAGGRPTDVSVSLSPVRDEQGVPQWWVVVVHDISRLKELDRLKSEFISTVSHELRTPLASIIGFAELLLTRDPGPLTEEQGEFLDIVYRSAETLLDLVNDLLDVSHIESGRFQLQLRPVDLAELAQSAWSGLQPLAEAKGLQARLHLPQSPPLIVGDPHRLAQVINNLLSNAIKFTLEGGQVDVSVAEVEESVQFTVSDTGIGIPTRDMDRLFSRFYRSAESINRAISGTGLGLYIAKSIVESHGGSIGINSQEGQGTTIWFRLPLSGPEWAGAADPHDIGQARPVDSADR